MTHRSASLAVFTAVFAGVLIAPGPVRSGAGIIKDTIRYPEARRSDQVDDYHGTKVADPYRWLEDLDSPETRTWVEAQNKLTFEHLEKIPQRDWIGERLEKLWNFERYGVPLREGARYFYLHNTGLQNQSVLYTLEQLDGEARRLLDPNTLAADGTVALTAHEPSPDGKLLAYSTASSGSDWNEIRVRSIDTGKDLEDHLRWVKFSGISWTPDSKGFYYSRYDEPRAGEEYEGQNYYQKVYFHAVGTKQEADPLIYQRQDQKEWGFGATVTDDGQYLVLSVWKGASDKNAFFYRPLADEKASFVELVSNFDWSYAFVDNEGPVFYFRTDRESPRGRLIAIDVSRPDPATWKTVIEQRDETLQEVNLIDGRFVASYLKDARSEVRVHDLTGKLEHEVTLPGIGTVAGFPGKKKDPGTFYSFTSYTTPTAIYRYEPATNRSTLFRMPEVAFDGSGYETRQVFYASKDGTKVPMFLTHKKGLEPSGENPTLLYGYGGFNNAITPSFSIRELVWLEMGGVYAVANLRGGGEYGEDWHQAGMRGKKQNVFDDFIAAAEHLIARKITRPEKLAIMGRSNGGLLVGACMTQRPDLFAVALPAVGVMDMLRYHQFTIGWAWADEYGRSDEKDSFPFLHAYSPLHRLKEKTRYPATLVTTADHDDRVVPGHSYKFAATLQTCQAGEAPVLIRIDVKAGHGAGKPTSKAIEEARDIVAFMAEHLGAAVPAAR